VTPESRLLQAVASARFRPCARDAIRTPASGIRNWPRLIALANSHAVLPFLRHQVDSCAIDLVPPDARDLIRAELVASSASSLRLWAKLAVVVRAFRERGIEPIAFKGPALAQQLYGTVAARQFTDLDVFIPLHQLPGARGALADLGFRSVLATTPSQKAMLARCWHVDPHTDGQVSIELHWDLESPRFSFGLAELLRADTPDSLVVAGVPIRSPSAPLLLLLLCEHGTKHAWDRLGWVADVAELLAQRGSAIWSTTWNLARRAHLTRALLVGIGLAESLLQAPLPHDASSRLSRDRVAQRLARVAAAHVFNPLPSPLNAVFWHAFFAACLDRPADSLTHLDNVLFASTPREWQRVDLPPSLAFLYRALRPLSLAERLAGFRHR